MIIIFMILSSLPKRARGACVNNHCQPRSAGEVSQVSSIPETPVPMPAGVAEALEMIRTGLRFVATADATQLTVAEQAKCLLVLERANSVAVAART